MKVIYGDPERWCCNYGSTFTSVDLLPSYEWIERAAWSMPCSDKRKILASLSSCFEKDLSHLIKITVWSLPTDKVSEMFLMALKILAQDVRSCGNPRFHSPKTKSERLSQAFAKLDIGYQKALSNHMNDSSPHIHGDVLKVNLKPSSLDLVVMELPPSVGDNKEIAWEFLPKVLHHIFPWLSDDGKLFIEHMPFSNVESTIEQSNKRRLENPFTATFFIDELEELAKYLESPKLFGPSRIFGITVCHASLEKTLVFMQEVFGERKLEESEKEWRDGLADGLRKKKLVQHPVQSINIIDVNIVDMFLVNYWMFSQQDGMRRVLEKIGYTNVIITQKENPYNHRKNVWAIEGVKGSKKVPVEHEMPKKISQVVASRNTTSDSDHPTISGKTMLAMLCLGIFNIVTNYIQQAS